jgi:hypothetical protein
MGIARGYGHYIAPSLHVALKEIVVAVDKQAAVRTHRRNMRLTDGHQRIALLAQGEGFRHGGQGCVFRFVAQRKPEGMHYPPGGVRVHAKGIDEGIYKVTPYQGISRPG